MRCINECEALLSHLERTIAAPAATPSRIVGVIENLPSATVEALRKLPPNLLGRLEDIAGRHGGLVPVHARLFDQWLHHAYPRECPYPHLSGTSGPITPERWVEQIGEEVAADAETLRWHVGQAADRAATQSTGDEEFAAELPWSDEEELFISHRPAPETSSSAGQTLRRGLAMVARACASATMHVRLLATSRHAASDIHESKVLE